MPKLTTDQDTKLSLRLPSDLLARLDAVARRTGKLRSAVIRDILENTLKATG